MSIKEITAAVQELIALGELRSSLDRCPNGNVKTQLLQQVNSKIAGNAASETHYSVPPQSIAVFSSSAAGFEGCFVVKFDEITFLLRIEGSLPMITFDSHKESSEHCKWSTVVPRGASSITPKVETGTVTNLKSQHVAAPKSPNPKQGR
jgi:hypothetical protein